MKISELSELQKSHLAFRLDKNTPCGMITAGRVIKGEFGDLELVEVFQKFGERSPHSAKILARKVMNFPTLRIIKEIRESEATDLLKLLAQHREMESKI